MICVQTRSKKKKLLARPSELKINAKCVYRPQSQKKIRAFNGRAVAQIQRDPLPRDEW